MTHVIGVNAVAAIASFEKMITGLGVPVKIEKTEDHVPSFLEKWVWFQVTRLEGDIKEVNGEAEQTPESTETVETSKETAKEEKKEESDKEAKVEKKAAAEDKKGAKDLKEKLESPKEKGDKTNKS